MRRMLLLQTRRCGSSRRRPALTVSPRSRCACGSRATRHLQPSGPRRGPMASAARTTSSCTWSSAPVRCRLWLSRRMSATARAGCRSRTLAVRRQRRASGSLTLVRPASRRATNRCPPACSRGSTPTTTGRAWLEAISLHSHSSLPSLKKGTNCALTREARSRLRPLPPSRTHPHFHPRQSPSRQTGPAGCYKTRGEGYSWR